MPTKYSVDELLKFSHRELVLHAVLLLRTVNTRQTKEKDIEEFSTIPSEELADYIVHFFDDDPSEWPEDPEGWACEDDYDYTPSCTYGDYSPSCPWNAPGMSIHDFI